MRALVGACALLLVTSAAADEPPRQKAGEWQIVQLGDHGPGSEDVSTMCVGDQSILAKFYSIQNCSQKESHTKGEITTANAQCRVFDTAMFFHQKVMMRGEDDFYVYTHVTYSPPAFRGTDLEEAETILFAHLKRLGPCPAGKKPLE